MIGAPLSIDICIMSVMLSFGSFLASDPQKAYHVCFLYFIKARFVDIVSAQIKDPLQLRMMHNSYLHQKKITP